MEKKLNLMKMEESSDMIRLIYDDEACLPPNRLSFKDWQREINDSIHEGSRIVWANPGYRNDWDSERRFLKSYSNYNRPDYPKDGIYTLEEIEVNRYIKGDLTKVKELCFKYLPGEGYWSWTGYQDRKNRISFMVRKDEKQILNYDQISLDDIDFYLESRIDRKNYIEYIPLLKQIKRNLLKEQEQEDQFSLMLIGECQKRDVKPKEGLTYERIIGDLIDWWKFKNKWKRPISKNDSLAMKMIEKRLFAITNKRKWFK